MLSTFCFINKFLNTDELNEMAKANSNISEKYVGTYPANVLPSKVLGRKECCWIANTDEEDDDGTHWVAFWKDNRKLIFFDSYGKLPDFYNREYWKTSLSERLGCEFVPYSTVQRQSMVSRTCGLWALLFLHEYAVGGDDASLTQFIPTVNANDLINNEVLLKNECLKYFSNMKPIYNKKCRESKNVQICCNFLEMKNKTVL